MVIRSYDQPPALTEAEAEWAELAEPLLAETEAAAFHDLTATLHLIRQGKISAGTTTRLPTLPSLRQLQARLLNGDYLTDQAYEKAEEAIRTPGLVVLAQAAGWAAANGAKLELTAIGATDSPAALVQPKHVKDAWGRWLKSDLLDELSRIRGIRNQQSKDTRLTKPSSRRGNLAQILRACPVGRWVMLDDLFEHIQNHGLSPQIEKTQYTNLYLGASQGYGWLGYSEDYWQIVVGSYFRVLLWEYAATLGMLDLAYLYPEAATLAVAEDIDLYDNAEYFSRYDGLLAVRLTALGAYVLGLSPTYAPPPKPAYSGPAALQILPNLDVVIRDLNQLTPVDRVFLESIATAKSTHVFPVSRDRLLEAAEQGIPVAEVRTFLASRSGISEEELPQTVRVFLGDLETRLNKLRDGGVMRLVESEDPYLIAELANQSTLRGHVRQTAIAGKPVLLVPEHELVTVRRLLKKLGYLLPAVKPVE